MTPKTLTFIRQGLAGLAFATLCATIPVACKPSAQQLNFTSQAAAPQLPEMGDLSKQTAAEADAKSNGCVSCHIEMDTKTMHESASVTLGCTDCHGGDATQTAPPGSAQGSAAYLDVQNRAHVLPKNMKLWGKSANPPVSGARANEESWEFIRFMNPGDLRVADISCGTSGCHVAEVSQVRKSMMSHGAHLWGAALYNNGAFPLKRAHFGESYGRDGQPQRIQAVPPPTEKQQRERGMVPYLNPLPRWEVGQPSNILRVFERGGRKPPDGIAIITQHTLPGGAATGFEHDDEPGKVVLNRLSQRGYGTLNRTDPVWLNLQKTRLLDPTLNHIGTNDKAGDYRSSGCTACHTIYANDRDPAHSGPFAEFGNKGYSHQKDPTIPKDESGHPIQHVFTSAIPSSQCVVCHMHPGTSVTQAYYGYMWWDNETHAELMYPEKPVEITPKLEEERTNFNPEGSVIRGKWGDPAFLEDMTSLNDQMATRLNATKFADFHGHGWLYKAVYKQDSKGNLLDAEGNVVAEDDPDKLKKAVHLQDIHLEKGMHCIDCHFVQDVHGDGNIYGAMRNAVEIDCVDCHGTITKRPTLKTSNSAAKEGGRDLSLLTTPFGGKRFVFRGKTLKQRSNVVEDLEWDVVQTVDTVTPGHKDYNEQSALAKTVQRNEFDQAWGDPTIDADKLAHPNDDMNCYTCHTSWMTSCFGCHLPMRANLKRPMLHNENQFTRNWTSYSFQTLREDVFMLGRDDLAMGRPWKDRKDKNAGRITTTRSACAIYVGSQNANREWVYAQQQTVSAEGFSGQAFAPSYAHTVRGKGETRLCKDCHLSEDDDNNAMMAMVLMQGNNAYNFYGRYVYVANGAAGVAGVQVGERDEPQAVVGSTLHKWAYPDRFAEHQARSRELPIAYTHPAGGPFNFVQPGEIRSVQHRGEYLYCASGARGLQIFDVANIDNKGFSQRITSAPFSPLGQYLWVDTKDATCVATPTTMGVDPTRQRYPDNMEQPIHLLYAFLYVTDSQEGLILVGAATLLDGDPANNKVERALTFNEGGRLTGARYVTIAGHYAYVLTDKALVTIDIDNPLEPKITSELPIEDPRQIALQFRYAFVATGSGLKVLDVTDMANPQAVQGAELAMDGGANSVYVVRTYAYVAAGAQGMGIVDVTNPTKPTLVEYFNGDGNLTDTRDVKVGITNASYFAYVADGSGGFDVVQLTSPDYTPGIQGFAVKPTPKHIASYATEGPCLAVEEGIDRDRAVDEAGNQLGVFGRVGSRPFSREEMEKMYLHEGKVWKVTNEPKTELDEEAIKEKIAKALGEASAGRPGGRPGARPGGRRRGGARPSRGGASDDSAGDDSEEESTEEEPSTPPAAPGGRRTRRTRGRPTGGSSEESSSEEGSSEEGSSEESAPKEEASSEGGSSEAAPSEEAASSEEGASEEGASEEGSAEEGSEEGGTPRRRRRRRN